MGISQGFGIPVAEEGPTGAALLNTIEGPDDPKTALLGTILLGEESHLKPFYTENYSRPSSQEVGFLKVETKWMKIGKIDFEQSPLIDRDTAFNLNQVDGFVVGEKMVWLVTSGGLRVLDKETNRWAFSAVLTPDVIRAKVALPDPVNHSVWFFGKGLFRHNTQTGVIESLVFNGQPFPMVRKMLSGRGGLWLATDAGIFVLDPSTGIMKTLLIDGKKWNKTVTDLVISSGALWGLTRDKELLHVRWLGDLSGSAALLGPLPVLSVASMVAMDGDLWLTVLREAGRGYILSKMDGTDRSMSDYVNGIVHLKPFNESLFFSSEYEIGLLNPRTERFRSALLEVHGGGSYSRGTMGIDLVSVGWGTVSLGMSYQYKAATGYTFSSAVYFLDPSKGWKDFATESYLMGGKKIISIQNSSNDFWVSVPGQLTRFVPRRLESFVYNVEKPDQIGGSSPFRVTEVVKKWGSSESKGQGQR